MALAKKIQFVAVEEYLQGELISQIKHEYINGVVYAMTGASEAHNLVVGNLFSVLHVFLRDTPCKVFMSDMKTRIQTDKDDCFFYPDIQVCCDPHDNQAHYKTQPQIIIEVLSSSTERFDRSEKFYSYKKLVSLEEYVLIAQDTQRIEIYRRLNNWELELFSEAEIHLQAVDFFIDFAELYRFVELGL